MTRFHLLTTAIALVASTAGSATTLVDGGFEAKGAATPVTDYCYDGFATPGGPACASSPWVGGGVIISGSGAWGGTAAAEGTYYGFVQGLSTVAQSFTATQSGTGTLTWLDANRGNNGGLQSYTVTLNDGATTTTLGTYTSAFGSFAARSATGFFLTGGTSYTLSFNGLATDDRTSFIDNVAISSVPEPSSWALLITGFGLVGVASRRRRRSVAA